MPLLRALRQAPWYSLAVIGVVAVTLSLAVTVFAIVDGLLFRPLPYSNASRLVDLEAQFSGLPRRVSLGVARPNAASELDVANWQTASPQARVTAFSVSSNSQIWNDAYQTFGGTAEIQANFFDVIGVQPLLGGFTDAQFTDAAPGAPLRPVIVLYDAWQRLSGGDTGALGRAIINDPTTGRGVRIVGVMPSAFSFPSTLATVDFLVPHVATPTEQTDPLHRRLNGAVARLPPGLSAETYAAQLAPGLTATTNAFPVRGPRPDNRSVEGWRREGPYDAIAVTPLNDALKARYGTFFAATFIAVTALVLIAAANVSSLMTARAGERRRELTVRRALGASATDLARLWLMEAGTLLGMGAGLGLVISSFLLHRILPLLPSNVVLLKAARLDWRVAGFAIVALTLLVAIVAMAPLRSSLRATRFTSTGTWLAERARTPARFLVIAGQVGAALVLTVLGSLLVGSVLAVYAEGLPPHASQTTVVTLALLDRARPEADQFAARLTRLTDIQDRLRHLNGVTDAAFIAGEVLSGDSLSPGFQQPTGTPSLSTVVWGVSDTFYRTIPLDVVQGRLPTGDELRANAPLVVVSERIARSYWPQQPPIGQALVHAFTKQPYTVVGVVRDVQWNAWDLQTPMIYAPYASIRVSAPLNVFVRTAGPAAPMRDTALRAIVEIDPLAKPLRASSLDGLFRESVILRRFQSWLFGGFAAAALAVVAVGILGLLAMSAARRTREIGIRCALGATSAGVVRLLLTEQFAAVGAGLGAGALVAGWAVGLVKAYTYHLAVTDLRVWLSAVALTSMAAGLGALVPALRASRVDPVRALRAD